MHMRTKALVLRETAYKESDKILTLLTQEAGKLTASGGAAGRREAPSPPAVSCWCGRTWCSMSTGAAGRSRRRRWSGSSEACGTIL